MTQYRQAGYCFMLSNGFDMFSSDMDEWYEVCKFWFIFQKLVVTINFYGNLTGDNYPWDIGNWHAKYQWLSEQNMILIC